MPGTGAPTPQSNSPQQSSFYIPSLDGLRAVAFLIVFLGHAGMEKWIPGYFGLTIFFFLSGFLITTLLRIEFEKTGTINLKNFYVRRALRIFPPFYLVLAMASTLTLLGILDGPQLSLEAGLFQVFHISNYYVISNGWWDGRAPGTWVYWSLAVEEHFYLVFPLLYLVLNRRLPAIRHQLLALLGICTVVLVWRYILVFGLDVTKDRIYVATDTRVDSILFGCILALYGNPVLDKTRFSERCWKLCWFPLGLAGIVLSFALRGPVFDQTLRYTVQGLALFSIFVVAIRFHNWAVFRLLNLGWVRFLGVLSYSLYLMHTSVIFGVQQWTAWHPLFQGLAALSICMLLAVVIYYLIEKPCAQLRRQLSRRSIVSRPNGAETPSSLAKDLVGV